ncbi:hypothetical protein DFH29DRAFT_983246 [Suillus ampliporus]|nr:hypothetical protein DFH29DRAFT_983246 [Suillus ampliporus]
MMRVSHLRVSLVYWTSPVYTFFHSEPNIEYVHGHWSHLFKCATKGCKKRVHQFLDTGDAKSTGNLRKHVKAATETKNVTEAHATVVQSILETGSIQTSFNCKGKGKVTYSHCQHTKTETCAEIVCWVSENIQPFEIVKDHGFQCLMKTGHPENYIPLPATVSHDV